jgi:hypothetical protein
VRLKEKEAVCSDSVVEESAAWGGAEGSDPLHYRRGWKASLDWTADTRTELHWCLCCPHHHCHHHWQLGTLLLTAERQYLLISSCLDGQKVIPHPPFTHKAWALLSTAPQVNSAATSRINFLQESGRDAGRRVKWKFSETLRNHGLCSRG